MKSEAHSIMEEFQQLVDDHYEALYRFGYSLAKNADRASDLVQQTYCTWAEKGHQLRDRSKAKTWLFTTLYREHLNNARRATRFSDQEISDVEHFVIQNEDEAERKMDGDRVMELLGQLDETFRTPLALFYLQQHSYKEISAILDVPIGTVMSRISRAKEQLRKKMVKEPASAPTKIISLNPELKSHHGH